MTGSAATTRIALGARAYDVISGAGALDAAMGQLRRLCPGGRLFCVSDETVAALHLPRLQNACAAAGIALKTLIIPPGEAQKSFARLQGLCSDLLDMNMERSEAIAAFGGGVVGDLAGFASAIVKRGTALVQIPTTLLAQVDSSVGGKTAINMPAGKNLVGAFHQPSLVIADQDFLKTLPPRQMRAGYAEILKAAALADADFFDWLHSHGAQALAGEGAALATAIVRAIAIKADIVARDEREQGVRALLNLGHSFGHALEALAGYDGALLHGEAVAAGMAAAFAYAVHLGLCPAAEQQRLEAHLQACGLPGRLSAAPGGPYTGRDMVRIMMNDKKNRDGVLRLVLPRRAGEAFVHEAADLAALEGFLDTELGRG